MGIVLALYLVLLLVVAPLASRAANNAILTAERPQLYQGTIGTGWFLAGLGAAVLWWDGTLDTAAVGLVGLPPAELTLSALATTVTLVAGLLVFTGVRRLAGRPESPQFYHLLPRTSGERRLFVGVALTAGIAEEFVFRGVAVTALAGLSLFDSPADAWLAAAVVSIGFGLGHGYQSGIGQLRAATLGFVLAVPFLLTGSLLPGMIAHAATDLSILGPLGRRMTENDVLSSVPRSPEEDRDHA